MIKIEGKLNEKKGELEVEMEHHNTCTYEVLMVIVYLIKQIKKNAPELTDKQIFKYIKDISKEMEVKND